MRAAEEPADLANQGICLLGNLGLLPRQMDQGQRRPVSDCAVRSQFDGAWARMCEVSEQRDVVEEKGVFPHR